MSDKKNYTFAIVLITSLFFFWGFIHNLDPILIKHLRSAFSLSHFQASLVDSAVFIAYFLLAIPAGWLMQRFGYKSGILVGLSLFALGCFLFVPAANMISYTFFLVALFVLSCGLTYTFSTPFITDDFQLDLTGTTDYFNNLSYIDSRKRITKQIMFNQAVHVRYSWNDYFESSLHANYVLNKARYDIPYKTKINIATMFIGIGAKSYISDNLALGFEMSQRFNDGYKNTIFNANQTLMNSFIEATFLKNKSISLRLQANDLFDQNKNSGIISEYIGNDVYEARNNRLGRYFMMSLNVRLQKLPKKN